MLTQSELKGLLDYDPETGLFTNKVTRSSNSVKGNVAGSIQRTGYVALSVNGKKYLAHRLVFLYVFGEFPKEMVDHKNHIRNDNRLCNLRECTNGQNMSNINRQNPCVYPNGSGFMVKIAKDKKDYYFGTYRTREEAELVAKINRLRLHGEFTAYGKEAINGTTTN